MVNMSDNITPLDPLGLYPYGMFTGAVPSVPSFYWNAVSDEQRWKALCLNMQTLANYANSLADEYNAIVEKLNTLGATPAGTTQIAAVPANTAVTVQIPYPTHTGSGTPKIALSVFDASGTNLSATVTAKGDDTFTVQVVNNSAYQASNVSVEYLCIFQEASS